MNTIEMSNALLDSAGAMSVGETVLAVLLGIGIVACALGVVLSRKAVHAAIYMVGVMLSLAMIYFAQGAEFLGAIQIVVYTGAIMMLFVFAIMMVGTQAVDSPRENRAPMIVATVLLGLALVVVVVIGILSSQMNFQKPLEGGESNPTLLAQELFYNYYFAMELAGALLVIGVVGAMTLTHTDRLLPKITQPFIVDERMKAYAKDGVHPGQAPAPGTYATSNSLDVPAISGETGLPIPESIPRVVSMRGEGRAVGEVAPWAMRQMREGNLHGGPNSILPQSGDWGMPGAGAPEITAAEQGAEMPALDSGAAEGEVQQ